MPRDSTVARGRRGARAAPAPPPRRPRDRGARRSRRARRRRCASTPSSTASTSRSLARHRARRTDHARRRRARAAPRAGAPRRAARARSPARHDVALRRSRPRSRGTTGPDARSASRSRACCARWPRRWCRARSARPTPRCGCASTRRRTMELLASLKRRPRLAGAAALAAHDRRRSALCDAARHYPGHQLELRRRRRARSSCAAASNLGIAADTPRGPDRAQHQGRRPARPGRAWPTALNALVDKAARAARRRPPRCSARR